MKYLAMGLSVALLCAASPSLVYAHGDTEILLGSTADGGGALAADYEFETVSKVSFSSMIGPISLYSGIFPPFSSLAADAPPVFALDDNTQVSLVITAVDAGKTSIKIGSTVLAAVGDSAALGTTPFEDSHPQYQLQLQLPEGEFGEGRISFKLTATGPTSYADSEVYTIKISNGPLPLPDFDTAAYDKGTVQCLSKAGKAVTKYVASKQKILGKCLDKVEALVAKKALATPPPDLDKAGAAAEKACADAAGSGPDSSTMLGKIAAARDKAVAAMQKACGASGSGTLTDDDINQQLGLADCRAEELTGAVYGIGHAELDEITARASQGGDAVSAHLPCLFLTASD